MATHYQLLSVEPSASANEIKKAFRAEIARYHPDKVQHLGAEFQQMAATRAAQLTEAYRTLMDPELRAAYDKSHVPVESAPAAPVPREAPKSSAAPMYDQPGPDTPVSSGSRKDGRPRFAQEHATRDEFVKKATLGRIRQAVTAEHGSVTEVSTHGFDFDCSTKSKKLFTRGETQRVTARFVPVVDRGAVEDTWASAQKAGGHMCVLLIGNGMSSARELADAIAELRKKSRRDSGVSIIPVDVRDWTAHMPADAPVSCRNILQRLRDTSA